MSKGHTKAPVAGSTNAKPGQGLARVGRGGGKRILTTRMAKMESRVITLGEGSTIIGAMPFNQRVAFAMVTLKWTYWPKWLRPPTIAQAQELTNLALQNDGDLALKAAADHLIRASV